jgi:hypothetical protein
MQSESPPHENVALDDEKMAKAVEYVKSKLSEEDFAELRRILSGKPASLAADSSSSRDRFLRRFPAAARIESW